MVIIEWLPRPSNLTESVIDSNSLRWECRSQTKSVDRLGLRAGGEDISDREEISKVSSGTQAAVALSLHLLVTAKDR